MFFADLNGMANRTRHNFLRMSAAGDILFTARHCFAGVVLFAGAGLVLSACTGSGVLDSKSDKQLRSEHINNESKFSVAEYQVAASPRVTAVKRPRKGGGRYQVGKPYKIRGKWYHPKEDTSLRQTGLASWYGPNFHGRLTANGEIYDQYSLSAAHPTMPLPSYAKVTNLANGREVMVRVNDRGPYAHGRVIDLSAKAAELLDFKTRGVTKVKVEYAGRARMDGLDESMLLATYRGPKQPGNDVLPGLGGASSGTMIAMADPIKPVSSLGGSPARAIDQGFGQGGLSLDGALPVPAQRPALFEGIPLADGNTAYRGTIKAIETVVSGPAPRPLAFASAGMAHAEGSFIRYMGEAPENPVTLVLGLPADARSAALMKQLLGDLGTVGKNPDTGEMELGVVEQSANAALAFVRQLGLNNARFR